MRHSKDKKKTHKGHKRISATKAKTSAPVTLEDLQRKQPPVDKDSVTTRQVSIRLIPDDDDSTTIRRNVEVLDNPSNILQMLRHRKAVEEAIVGNNITTGPTQYAFVRQFLTGESLRVFNEGAVATGNETTANLIMALNHLVTFNCPREVLSKQTDYMKSKLYKPYDLTTRQYVGYYNNLNSICAQLPPAFNDNQKLSERELIINIAGKAPKPHKKMLIQQGYNPENGSMADLIDYCERAETTENVEHGAKQKVTFDDSSSESEPGLTTSRTRKHKTRKKESRSTREIKTPAFYCRYHKENDSHNTEQCKVLNNGSERKPKRSNDWKDTSKQREKKYKRELNLIQSRAKRYKNKLAKLQMDSDSSTDDEPNNKRRQRKRITLDLASSDESSQDEAKSSAGNKQDQDESESESTSSSDSE